MNARTTRTHAQSARAHTRLRTHLPPPRSSPSRAPTPSRCCCCCCCSILAEPKDVVDLDVSGERLSVKRRTLMLCEDSALARQFDDAVWTQRKGRRAAADGGGGSGEQEEEIDEEDDGYIFIEQPTYAFTKLVDQLRLIATAPEGNPPPPPTVLPHEQNNFEHVLSYYFPGCASFVLRPGQQSPAV